MDPKSPKQAGDTLAPFERVVGPDEVRKHLDWPEAAIGIALMGFITLVVVILIVRLIP